MIKVLERTVNELNPLHDFDRFTFYRPGDVFLGTDSTKRFENIRSNGRFLFWVPKHMVRGFVVGAALGALVGWVSDGPSVEMADACVVGARYGFQVDVVQYLIRGAYHLFKGSCSSR